MIEPVFLCKLPSVLLFEHSLCLFISKASCRKYSKIASFPKHAFLIEVIAQWVMHEVNQLSPRPLDATPQKKKIPLPLSDRNKTIEPTFLNSIQHNNSRPQILKRVNILAKIF